MGLICHWFSWFWLGLNWWVKKWVIIKQLKLYFEGPLVCWKGLLEGCGGGGSDSQGHTHTTPLFGFIESRHLKEVLFTHNNFLAVLFFSSSSSAPSHSRSHVCPCAPSMWLPYYFISCCNTDISQCCFQSNPVEWETFSKCDKFKHLIRVTSFFCFHKQILSYVAFCIYHISKDVTSWVL